MRISSSGKRKPSYPLRWLQRAITASSGTTRVDVRDGEHCYSFNCTNLQTLRRATTLLIKEPGTIRWLRQQAQPGRTFLDIGANVGIYSIFAAHHLGPTGRVYSAEPHLRNASALLDNVMLNQLRDQVSVMSLALSEDSAIIDFRYTEWGTGSSHSQLQTGDPITMERPALANELKATTSIDKLIEQGAMPAPDFIKIDVDGIELSILRGATQLLQSERRPGSIQVECEPSNFREIEAFMQAQGYREVEKHATMAGAKRIARGAKLEELAHNVIYEPA